METRDWINLGYILIVIVVFVLQHYQIKKQNNLLGYYDKIFDIIKIDEIEKYVKLKEENVKLEIDNKYKTLSGLIEKAKVINDDAGLSLKDAGTLLEKLHAMELERETVLKIIHLTKDELTESYDIIFNELDKAGNEEFKDSLNNLLYANIKKFEAERNKLFKNLKKL